MLHFEDFYEGQVIELGQCSITQDEIIAFAREYDPQPFHLDEEAARQSIFGGLAASGWHTAALYMRLYVDNLLNKSTSQGSPGVEELRWLKPVRPNDTLTATYRITTTRPSEKRPDIGIIKGIAEMYNQHGDLVMSFRGAGFLRRRQA